MACSLVTGSDLPVFVCFFAQLLKADPGALLQVMIDKGDANRAAFDEKVADAARAAVASATTKSAREKKKADASSDDASDDEPGRRSNFGSRPDAAGAA